MSAGPNAGVAPMQQRVEEAVADGFEVAQQGRVLRPPEPGVSFADRVEGFSLQALGRYDDSNGWRGTHENRLLEEADRWVHLRRPRAEA